MRASLASTKVWGQMLCGSYLGHVLRLWSMRTWYGRSEISQQRNESPAVDGCLHGSICTAYRIIISYYIDKACISRSVDSRRWYMGSDARFPRKKRVSNISLTFHSHPPCSTISTTAPSINRLLVAPCPTRPSEQLSSERDYPLPHSTTLS